MVIGLKSALAMLKRKKMQSFLIGLTITLTSLLIFIGLSLMNQTAPFDKMYSRANGSENLLLLNTKVHDVSDIKNWFLEKEAIESVSELNAKQSKIEFIKDNEKVSTAIFLTEFESNSNQDIIYVRENERAISPKDGEIYISYYFANDNGLEIGDKVKVHVDEYDFEFIVGKIVVDPQFNNGFMSPYRCFVTSDFFQENSIDSDTALLGIKYKSYNSEIEKEIVKDFDKYMLDNIQPTLIQYSMIDASFNMIANLISVAFLLISIFMFLIVVFIIRATVRNEILQQYKTIGVRKVIGYSKKQIRQTFLYMYLIIGLIGASIGTIIGLPVKSILEETLTSNMQVGDSTTFSGYFVITILIIIGLLFIFVSIAANKANQIKPVQAIKYGMPENKLKHTGFRVDRCKNVPLSLVLAIKQILMNKRKSVVSIVSIMIITFVSLTISNITGSMLNARHFANSLNGINAGDVTVTYSGDLPIKDVVNKLEDVENVNCILFNTKIWSESTLSKDGDENIPLLGTILIGDALNKTINLTDGRQPLSSDEIVISSQVGEKTGRTIGDYITIKKENGERRFLITGLYDSVIHSGLSYVVIENVDIEEQNYKNGYFWLYLNDKNVIMEEIEANITEIFGDDVMVTEFDSDALQIINSIEALPSVSNMILIIFLIVCGVIVFNWTLIDISKSVKTYGILKATGFSNKELRVLLMVKSILLTLIGVLVGYFLCVLTIDKVMIGMFKLTPFSTIKLPVVFSHTQGIFIALLYCVIAITATLIPTKRLGNISPKNLIAE